MSPYQVVSSISTSTRTSVFMLRAYQSTYTYMYSPSVQLHCVRVCEREREGEWIWRRICKHLMGWPWTALLHTSLCTTTCTVCTCNLLTWPHFVYLGKHDDLFLVSHGRKCVLVHHCVGMTTCCFLLLDFQHAKNGWHGISFVSWPGQGASLACLHSLAAVVWHILSC